MMLKRCNQLGTNLIRSCALQSRCASSHRVPVEHEHCFTEEHAAMRASLRKIIDADINPYVDEWERAGSYPAKEVFGKLGKAGFLGAHKRGYGDSDLDYTYAIAVAEEIGSIRCGGVPMSIGVQTDMATPALARYGSEELRQQFLYPSVRGELVGCIGVSESGAGSDVASLKTTARVDGDDLVINGSKMWITNGGQADWMCLLARTEADQPVHSAMSLICLPMKTKGVKVNRLIDKMGMRCSDTAEIFFDDVRVPLTNVIGKRGEGFTYQMQQFQEERMIGVALALNPMEFLIDETAAYCSQRQVFNAPLLANQTIQFKLAELETEVEALRSLLYRAAALYSKGHDVTKLASMAKLKGGRLAQTLTSSCLQYWGGMGFTNEVVVSRFYRDFRLLSIGGGADEVMLGIISKLMGIVPSRKKTK
ncbi:probable acyl-CoA dehydrogenase 6 [Sycon ciliatum]|uniref:probable acyl-CoA dehydrogenase 6 n=1 Tax=Sycon ciliatum TaxID=27933 RepID=UPI0031F6ED64